MSQFTQAQIDALNEWARTQPSLRAVFPYTRLSDPGRAGLGDLLSGIATTANSAVQSGLNLGAGSGEVFKQKSGTVFQFRTLVAGNNVSISQDASEITITSQAGATTFYLHDLQDVDAAAPSNSDTLIYNSSTGKWEATAGGGGGEVNTASNLGAGSGVFASKAGVDLQFRSLTAGSNITITSSASELLIASTAGGFYGIVISQTDDAAFFSDIKKVNYEAEHFYITQNASNTDEVQINLRGVAEAGHTHTKSAITDFKNDPFYLNDVQDVNAPSPSDGQVLKFDSATNKWIPATDVTGGAGGGSGFYGITVKHSDDTQAFRGVNVVGLNVSDFYVTQNDPNTDEVVVNLRGGAGGVGPQGPQGPQGDPGPGFYGTTVKHSDDTQAYKNINTVAFNVSDFYVTQNDPNTDEVVVNLRGDKTEVVAGNNTSVVKSGNTFTVSSDVSTSDIPPRFYGIIVKQTDDAASFNDIKIIGFNKNDFYITQNAPNTDEVIINARDDSNLFDDLDDINITSATDLDVLQYDSAIAQWTNSQRLLMPDGSVTAPSYSFDSESRDGVYKQTSSSVDITISGSRVASFGANTLDLQANLLTNATALLNGGTLASPGLQLGTGPAKPGLYRDPSTDFIRFAHFGINTLIFTANGLDFTDGGSLATRALTFLGTTGPGVYSTGASGGGFGISSSPSVRIAEFDQSNIALFHNTGPGAFISTQLVNFTNNLLEFFVPAEFTGQVVFNDQLILRRGTVGFYLNFAEDVNVPSPSDGQILKFNTSAEKWEAANESTVDISGISEFYGITVKHSDDTQAYRNLNTVAFNVNDFYVTQNDPNTDEVMVNLRGFASTNHTHTKSDITDFKNDPFYLNDAEDINAAAPGDGQALAFNASSGKWEPTTIVSSSSTPGFYGITVKQADDTQAFRGINLVSFNKNDFYVTQNAPNTDEVQVNLRSPALNKVVWGFRNKVEIQVQHNFGDNNLVWSMYDTIGRDLLAEMVNTNDKNIAYFYFLTPVSGKAVLIG